MRYHNVFLRLALISSETCFLILLIFFLMGLFQGSPLLNPLFFFVLSGVLTLINMILAAGNFQRLTIVGINILLLGIFVSSTNWQTGFILFSIPLEGLTVFNIILVHSSILWLGYRSLYLAYHKSTPNVYSHFDWCIFLTFLVFISMGVAKISLPGGITWIIAAVFVNLLPLYIDNNTGEKINPLSGWVLSIAITMLLYLSAETVSLFPHISGTAGGAIDMFGKVLLFLVNILVSVFSLWNKFSISNTRADLTDQSATKQNFNPLPNADSTWQHIILQGVTWFLLIMLCVCVIMIVFYFIRFLISWLFQRQVGKSRRAGFNPIFLWKNIYASVLKNIKKVSNLIILLLPVRMSTDHAYGQLLRWGCWKKCPRQIDETPYDYYQRLADHYPELSSELETITSFYVVYRYSDECPSDLMVPQLKSMVRKVYLSDFYRLVIRIKRKCS
ncbi:hypothetical protein SAMN02746098_03065 [Desulfosporosinus lacus DSM 15449]|uniref:Protein-glutamine gamma-glutamyltransferase-like C-terminal domain-containing protein n=2 Tax=Desulfosporosinus TaxID=79206 RepID=A0A1M5Z7N4_9FIRM|nr:hypothetical protein SAMN02746098_03065 [Desulfosporosinus lacus DSM 15449]